MVSSHGCVTGRGASGLASLVGESVVPMEGARAAGASLGSLDASASRPFTRTRTACRTRSRDVRRGVTTARNGKRRWMPVATLMCRPLQVQAAANSFTVPCGGWSRERAYYAHPHSGRLRHSLRLGHWRPGSRIWLSRAPRLHGIRVLDNPPQLPATSSLLAPLVMSPYSRRRGQDAAHPPCKLSIHK